MKINNLLIQHFVCFQRRASAYKCQEMFGRHGAHKHHDSMGEVSNNIQWFQWFYSYTNKCIITVS